MKHVHCDAATVARRFAAALDAADWGTVVSLMAPACTYACRGSTTVGAGEIVASYRAVDEWVKTTFEDVRYDSEVQAEGKSLARLSFRDRMRHGAHRLDFRCQQRIELDSEGRIARIEHIDLPGEREKADRFNEACGVQRP